MSVLWVVARAVPISPLEHGGYRSLIHHTSNYGGAALSLSFSGVTDGMFLRYCVFSFHSFGCFFVYTIVKQLENSD
jgi:hypothetical protein